MASRTPEGWTQRSHSLQGLSPASSGVALGFDSTDAAHVAIVAGLRVSILRFGTLGVSTLYASPTSSPAKISPHSLQVDSNDGIHLAFWEPSAGSIVVATRAALWSSINVDKPVIASAPALALDASNRWVVAYVDLPKHQLKVSAKAWYDFARPDFDDDGHVDGQDIQHFAACVTGPSVSQSELSCLDADLDSDGDVDLADFGVLQACYSGAVEPAYPQCAD